MEKLIHERLRESLGKLDDCCNISSETINHLRSDLGLTEDQKSYANDLRNIINYIADQVEKYYIPRPRFDDGEPVQFGDDIEIYNLTGLLDSGIIQSFHPNNGRVWMLSLVGVDHERLVRFDPGTCVIKRHKLRVLDADGVEIKAGDTVWVKHSGVKQVITRVENGNVHGNVGHEPTPLDPTCLTHREPDSLKKLRDDMNYRIIEGTYPGTAHEYLCQCAKRLTAIMERDA